MAYDITDYLTEDIDWLFEVENSSENDSFVSYDESENETEYSQDEDRPDAGESAYTAYQEEMERQDSLLHGELTGYLREKRYMEDEPYDTDDYEYQQDIYSDNRGDDDFFY